MSIAQLHPWWAVLPGIAGFRQAIAIVEQRVHIGRVELFSVLDIEVGADKRQIVFDAILPSRRIDAVEVADPLRLNERGDRPVDDAEGAALRRGPFGIEPRIADDVGVAPTLDARDARGFADAQ